MQPHTGKFVVLPRRHPPGDRMAALIKDGKSESDIHAAKPFADLDAKRATSEQAGKNFVRVVYFSMRE